MRFSAFELKAPTEFGPITPGFYDVTVADASWRENSLHTGEIVSVKLTINGPTFVNRCVYVNFNIRNASEKAQEIGQQQMSDFTRACGFDKLPDDTDAYVGCTLTVKIGLENPAKLQPGQEQRNTVLSFKKLEGSAVPVETVKIGSTIIPPWFSKK
jgi:hypothetical protein